MESQRQRKFSRLIQKELGEIFQRDRIGMGSNHFFTVMEVRMSPDLSVAKVFISFMLDGDKEGTFEMLNDKKKEIRNLLGRSIGGHVKRVPELIFYLDEVEENAARLEDLLNNLDIPPASDDEEE